MCRYASPAVHPASPTASLTYSLTYSFRVCLSVCLTVCVPFIGLQLYNQFPNFMTYLVDGQQHCFTPSSKYFTAGASLLIAAAALAAALTIFSLHCAPYRPRQRHG